MISLTVIYIYSWRFSCSRSTHSHTSHSFQKLPSVFLVCFWNFYYPFCRDIFWLWKDQNTNSHTLWFLNAVAVHQALLACHLFQASHQYCEGWQDLVCYLCVSNPRLKSGCGLLKATRNGGRTKLRCSIFSLNFHLFVEPCFFSCNNLNYISYFFPWSMQHISVNISYHAMPAQAVHFDKNTVQLKKWPHSRRLCDLNVALMLLRILL